MARKRKRRERRLPEAPAAVAPKERYLVLDSTRGLMLVQMLLNHLMWIVPFYIPIQVVTLNLSSAQGFLFISGCLAGIVYGAKPKTGAGLVKKAWFRAFEIYAYQLTAVILASGWVLLHLVLKDGLVYFSSEVPHLYVDPRWAVGLSAALLNQPGFIDILPLYIGFMLLLPLGIAALRRNLWWLVLLISFGAWAASGTIDLPLRPAFLAELAPLLALNPGYFDFSAWQLVFFLGLVLGFQHVHRGWRVEGPWWLTISVLAAVLGISVIRNGLFGAPDEVALGIADSVDKPELGWLRLLHFMLFVYLFAWAARRRPGWLTFRWLTFLGQHSLQVYAFHAVLIYALKPLLLDLHYFDGNDGLAYLVVAGAVVSLTIPAWIHRRYRQAAMHSSEVEKSSSQ